MAFSQKLNELMLLSGATNIKLARVLSVDPSLVSRWRNGSRRPAGDPSTLLKIALFFTQRMSTEYHRAALADAVGLQTDAATPDDDMAEALVSWLSDTEGEHSSGKARQEGPLVSGVQTNAALTGPAGRRTILGRLHELYDPDTHDVTIRFYSNEPADWIRADIEHRHSLKQDESLLFDNVSDVKLILHTNASEDELIHIIYYMMPFLKNGTMHIAHVPRFRGELFTHTLLMTGESCAAASHGFADSDNFMVDIFTEKSFLRQLSADFDRQFDQCEPVHTTNAAPTPLDIMRETDEMMQVEEPITYLGNTIPGPAIPPGVFRQVARRVQRVHPLEDMDIAAEYLHHYETFLKAHKYYLFMPLYTPEEVAGGAASLAYLPRILGSEAALTQREYLDTLVYLRQRCEENRKLIVSFIPELDHEHYLLLQPNSMLCAVKNLNKAVIYKSRFAGFLSAFLRYLCEKYGPPKTMERRRAAQLARLDAHIRLFREHLGA